jgi:toluene monooxygenase system ferredoxin subunit
MRAVVVDGARVLLVNVEGEVSAYLDRCAHQGYPLSRGSLEGCTLRCALHGWVYDARTGAGINPRSACLTNFPVRIEGDAVLVDVAAVGGPDARGASGSVP